MVHVFRQLLRLKPSWESGRPIAFHMPAENLTCRVGTVPRAAQISHLEFNLRIG